MTDNHAEITQTKLDKLEQLDRVGLETLMALLQCKTQVDAAKVLSITPQALWLRMKKYNLYEIVAEFPKQALMKLQLGSSRAADVLIDKLDDRKDSLEAAKEVLDRVGISGKPDTMNQFNAENMKVEFE